MSDEADFPTLEKALRDYAKARDFAEIHERERACLYFFAAIRALSPLREQLSRSELAALADCYAGFARLSTSGIGGLSPDEAQRQALSLWDDLHEQEPDGGYRALQVALRAERKSLQSILSPEEQAFLSRPLDELRAIAVCLRQYEILVNDDNEVMFAVPGEHPRHSQDALLFYDGGPHGLLFKGAQRLLVCDHVNEAVRDTLLACDEVLIYEADNSDEEMREYMARVVYAPSSSSLAAVLFPQLD